MLMAMWLLQEAAESAADNTTTVRVIAGALALVMVVII